MATSTKELIEANDALRAEYPTAILVDASLRAKGFHLMVMPGDMSQDVQTGVGMTVAHALADLRGKFAIYDPVEKLRKQWIAAGRPDLNADVEARRK